MSGTSADGISAVAAEFKENKFRIMDFHTDPLSIPLQKLIHQAPHLTANEISELNFHLGEAFAISAKKLMRRLNLKPKHIACIGSHGQTAYHDPNNKFPNTLQIGESAVIAERTGVPVVSNFRERDMAAGGEGAPLVPFFDDYFFGGGPVRALQNIGGIANVTVVGKNLRDPLAFDTGPGNGLMDEAVRIITKQKKSFDKNGELARHGTIDLKIIQAMMANPFFGRKPPKSTGLERFGRAFLLKHLGQKLKRKPQDALATLCFFTALSIYEAYRTFIFPRRIPSEIIVSGGGVKNKTLMWNLTNIFDPIPVVSVEKYGIPVLAKEPLAFAFMALRAMQGKINHLPHTTGAVGPRILGKISMVPGQGVKSLHASKFEACSDLTPCPPFRSFRRKR